MSHFDFDLFFYPTLSFELLFNPLEIKRNKNLQLIHIATAGGYISNQVHSNTFNHRMRHKLKNSIGLDGPVRINPNLESILGTSLDKDLNTPKRTALNIYTSNFSEYAQRNCFSFDRTHISNPLINLYHLVAAPPDKNAGDKIPDHGSPYHFSFCKFNNFTFLLLNNIYELLPDLADFSIPINDFCSPLDCNSLSRYEFSIKSSIIGISPFEWPKYS
ncbi:hypothetical protein ACEUBU_12855 [Aeromonas caviae]|uniref:hypothetical protein n=1 Tax=Aeromonas caviae TaxID=648 RepID=UPI0038D107A3